MSSRRTSVTEFLGDAITDAPDVTFHTVDALFDHLAALPADCDRVVVGKVSVNAFHSIEAERDLRGRRYRFLFLPATKCLIVTVPTGRHEQAYKLLSDYVTVSIHAMGLEDQWVSFAAEKFTASRGSGEGDASGGPRFAHDGSVRAWPLLVIEAGATQSMQSLRGRARWWFAASDYAMKVVILVKLFSNNCSIHIEKWTAAAPGPQRAGATTTRAHGAVRQPSLDHVVIINWTGPDPLPQTPVADRTLAHFDVEGAPLVLRFNELMDREPIAAAGEHDISIPEARLQRLAQRVWERP